MTAVIIHQAVKPACGVAVQKVTDGYSIKTYGGPDNLKLDEGGEILCTTPDQASDVACAIASFMDVRGLTLAYVKTPYNVPFPNEKIVIGQMKVSKEETPQKLSQILRNLEGVRLTESFQ